MSAHSLNAAARALERALSAQFPEHTWIAEVRQDNRADATGNLRGRLAAVDQSRPGLDDSDALAKRRARSAATAAAHDHDLKKSA